MNAMTRIREVAATLGEFVAFLAFFAAFFICAVWILAPVTEVMP